MADGRRLISLGFDTEFYPVGTHMCYIFDDDDERRRLMGQYVQSGLEGNEQVGYFVDTMPPDLLKKSLRESGADLPDALEGTQYSIIEAELAYCPDGTFVVDRMLDTLRQAFERSAVEGYAGARLTGEMTWSTRGHPGSEYLLEYEARINVLVRTVPTTAICQYDAHRFDGATIYGVLSVHPMMIVHGQVHRNPFYIEPEALLGRAVPRAGS